MVGDGHAWTAERLVLCGGLSTLDLVERRKGARACPPADRIRRPSHPFCEIRPSDEQAPPISDIALAHAMATTHVPCAELPRQADCHPPRG
jgi:hypothetical protein